MPKAHSKSVAKLRSEVRARLGGFLSRVCPMAPSCCPNPRGTFIYRIAPAMRGVPEFSWSPLHSRELPCCWRLDEHREGRWWQHLPWVGGSVPPSPVTGPALLAQP